MIYYALYSIYSRQGYPELLRLYSSYGSILQVSFLDSLARTSSNFMEIPPASFRAKKKRTTSLPVPWKPSRPYTATTIWSSPSMTSFGCSCQCLSSQSLQEPLTAGLHQDLWVRWLVDSQFWGQSIIEIVYARHV